MFLQCKETQCGIVLSEIDVFPFLLDRGEFFQIFFRSSVELLAHLLFFRGEDPQETAVRSRLAHRRIVDEAQLFEKEIVLEIFP